MIPLGNRRVFRVNGEPKVFRLCRLWEFTRAAYFLPSRSQAMTLAQSAGLEMEAVGRRFRVVQYVRHVALYGEELSIDEPENVPSAW